MLLPIAALIVTALPIASRQQAPERITLSGDRVAVYNIAGIVSIESGSGNAVVVEVTRRGSDGNRLRTEQRTIDGRATLCIVYPDERILYRPNGTRAGSNYSSSSTGDGGCYGRRRIEVRSRGDGVEASADVRIIVPAGRDVKIWHFVGEVDVANVNATLGISAGSTVVTTRGTSGALHVNTGSGNVTLSGHRGDLRVGAGSGTVRFENIDARSVALDAGSGDMRGTGVTADEVRVKTGSGNVEVSSLSARRVSIGVGSGNTRIGFNGAADDVRIVSGSGNVTLALPSDFGARLNVQTGSGDIDSDFAIEVGRTRRGSLQGTIGNGRATVDITTGSGGVRLRRS